MTDSSGVTRTPKDFAEERSHRDAVVSNETGRATAQAAILINGGAATAVLAYLAKDGLDPSLVHRAAWCLVLYGFGVVSGSVMLYCMIRSRDYYSVRWRDLAYPDGSFQDSPADKNARKKAFRWLRTSYWFFGAAMTFFLLSSAFMAVVLYTLQPIGSKCATYPIEKA